MIDAGRSENQDFPGFSPGAFGVPGVGDVCIRGKAGQGEAGGRGRNPINHAVLGGRGEAIGPPQAGVRSGVGAAGGAGSSA
jgi:hypothetical protein